MGIKASEKYGEGWEKVRDCLKIFKGKIVKEEKR